jgi:iron(III) transport system substrate-binding protein
VGGAAPTAPVLGRLGSGSAFAAEADYTVPSAASAAELMTKLYEAAKKEGSVAWYTSVLADAATSFANAFEAKFPGVKVETYRATVAQVLQKYSQETAAGVHNADVFGLSSPGQSPQFLESGFVTPYKIFDYDKFPASAHGNAELFELFDKYTPYGAIVFNTEHMSKADAPKSFKEMAALDPERYRGKIIMSDPRIYPYLINYVLWTQTDGRAMPQQFKNLHPTLTKNSSAVAQGVVSGEYWLTPTFNMQAYVAFAASNAPIDFVIPEEGIWMQPGSHLVVKDAPHPNAARLFLEYIYSEEGQTVWSAPGYVATRPGVPLPKGLEWVPDAKVTPIDFEEVFRNQDALLPQISEDLGLNGG